MLHRARQMAVWILSRLVAKDEREPLLGDLAEEYALRASASSPAALKWCVQQICASAPYLLWARLARAGWMATVGVALLAYVGVAVAQLIVNRAISGSSVTYDPVSLLVMFPIVVLIGYVAARFRGSAALVLGAMMLLVVAAMTAGSAESPPMGYRIAFFLVGPAGAVIGEVLCSLGRTRS